MLLVGELARELDLPELAVVVGRVAPEKGFASFTQVGFPTVADPGRGRLDDGPRDRPPGKRVRQTTASAMPARPG